MNDSAQNGFALSQWFLGYSYLNGRILDEDKDKASFWLNKSVENGLNAKY
ncbi:MAG: SEL1-like repeat protein [bacterium]|nr:SEL1-like repeat protein [bacterium]